MAKKGETARADVMDTIAKAFKDIDAFETIADKKIYVWAQDGAGGERIQFAISITAPKTPVLAAGSNGSTDGAWSEDNAPKGGVGTAATPMELSAEDKAKVKALMDSLGLN